MTTQKLTILNIHDIKAKKVSIQHKNAFIFPDGTFCLAEGYTGYNPSQQLESTALEIAQQILKKSSLKTYYNIVLQGLQKRGAREEEINSKRLYFLRDILIHYYGYSLFARIQRRENPLHPKFWDASVLPNPTFFGKSATLEQIQTLHALFELNNDGTVLPSSNEEIIKDSFQKVLTGKKDSLS